jgi:hypothetical protein
MTQYNFGTIDQIRSDKSNAPKSIGPIIKRSVERKHVRFATESGHL